MSYWLRKAEGEKDLELILVNVTSKLLNRLYIRVVFEKLAFSIKLSTADNCRVLRPYHRIVTGFSFSNASFRLAGSHDIPQGFVTICRVRDRRSQSKHGEMSTCEKLFDGPLNNGADTLCVVYLPSPPIRVLDLYTARIYWSLFV